MTLFNSHKAGFVTLLGKSNAGKSTLLNALVAKRLAVVTEKAGTTRHCLHGISNTAHYQIIYCDTPSVVVAQSPLQKIMVQTLESALAHTHVVLCLVDARDKAMGVAVQEKLEQVSPEIPILLVVNKSDSINAQNLEKVLDHWRQSVQVDKILPVSALKGEGLEQLVEAILAHLPERAPYYSKDIWTDRTEQFLAAELIQEQLLHHYYQEVPYSASVLIHSLQKMRTLVRIESTIYVERDSQKIIVVGTKGEAIRRLNTAARKSLEAFFGERVYLKQNVDVLPAWHQSPKYLQHLGYM